MSFLKNAFLDFARATGVIALARKLRRGQVRILAYHGVEDVADPVLNFDGFQVAPGVFRQQMEHLRACYNVRSLADIAEDMGAGRDIRPGTVAITFDDGYANNLHVAAPILREFGFPATFFVTTGFTDGRLKPWWYEVRALVTNTAASTLPAPDGRALPIHDPAGRMGAVLALEAGLKRLSEAERDQALDALRRAAQCEPGPVCRMMTAADVKQLADMGFEVGPHTVRHVSLATEDEVRAKAEITESTADVRRFTGRAPRCYSYPYGQKENIPAAISAMLREQGFVCAVTAVAGLNASSADVFRLKRINVSGNHRAAAFEALVAGLRGR